MGRQLRTLHRGEVEKLIDLATTGNTVQSIPNYGVTYITNSSAESYVLDPPVEGVRKTICVSAAASSVTVILANTDTATAVRFNSTGAGTKITAGGTVDRVIELVGINSTLWFIVNTRPGIAVNATGWAVGTT